MNEMMNTIEERMTKLANSIKSTIPEGASNAETMKAICTAIGVSENSTVLTLIFSVAKYASGSEVLDVDEAMRLLNKPALESTEGDWNRLAELYAGFDTILNPQLMETSA